jgi:hypothetical protein
MNAGMFSAVHAVVKWSGLEKRQSYSPIRPGYTAHIGTIPPNQLHDEDQGIWDVIVRQVKWNDVENQTAEVVFQLASPRAPHEKLEVGMTIGFVEFFEPSWIGEIVRLEPKPLSASYWRNL